jgi:hypothetical protein
LLLFLEHGSLISCSGIESGVFSCSIFDEYIWAGNDSIDVLTAYIPVLHPQHQYCVW